MVNSGTIKIAGLVALALLATAGIATYYYRAHHTTNGLSGEANGASHYIPNYVMLFHSYKKDNGLKFGAAEDGKRFAVFVANARIVEAHNKKNSSYTLGLTPLAHLTREEFAALKLGYKSNQRLNSVSRSNVVAAGTAGDQSVDWSAKGAVTPVKNQGSCGSCWSFSSTGALEGLKFINDGKLVSMSEQELVDCSTKYGNNGCNGGLMTQAFQYVAANGISSEDSYPYTATDGRCKATTKTTKVFKNKGFQNVASGSPSALTDALNKQPVSVAIEADTSAFQLYKSGVLTGDACGTRLDHGVLAVGYGVSGGQAYYKVKNSWGPSWGDKGFVLIGRSTRTSGDAGICGINLDPSYPTL